MYGVMSQLLGDQRYKPTLHIPHAALHSSLVAITWLAWQSMPVVEYVSILAFESVKEHTKIHDVVSTDGTIVDNDVWQSLRVSARPTTINKETLPHAQRDTAFHYIFDR
jgi:hypothetical protein